MLMVAVVSFAILSFTVFFLKNKRLHLFELLAIWLSVMVVNSPMYTYFLVNQYWASVSDSGELAVIRIVYTEVLNPLFITWILDEVLDWKNIFVRIACYAATLGLLFLGGVILDQWGGIQFTPIGLWMYIPFKLIVLIAALCSVWLVRFLMRKDGVGGGQISRN